MTINPVLFGVLATLFIEQSITLVVIWTKSRRNSHNTTKSKGGKYNG